jgi:hypothetical protein
MIHLWLGFLAFPQVAFHNRNIYLIEYHLALQKTVQSLRFYTETKTLRLKGDGGIKKSTDPANNLPKIMMTNLPAY